MSNITDTLYEAVSEFQPSSRSRSLNKNLYCSEIFRTRVSERVDPFHVLRFPALGFAVFDIIMKGIPCPKLFMLCVVRLFVFVRRDMAVNCTV